MKKIATLLFAFLTFAGNAQIEKAADPFLTVSPIINKENLSNALVISALDDFLKLKNKSVSENIFWAQGDFEKYVYPYLDVYNIEQSKYGKDFYKPTLMEIIETENVNKKIIKIAFIGHNPENGENLLKAIYNIVANIDNKKVTFSKYLDLVTEKWQRQQSASVKYIVSENKKVNREEIDNQKKDIDQLCKFFKTIPFNITYYSCINPKEVFEIKGFDYNIMMYVDKSGGLADFGNIIFSGNSSEIYTHEIVHVYINNLYPRSDQFLGEGIATYIAGSGKYKYIWHREKLNKFISENPNHNFKNHFDPYERLYFEDETSIPYVTSALICERTKRLFGDNKLLEILSSETEIWKTLNSIGLTKDNINQELRNELKMQPISLW